MAKWLRVLLFHYWAKSSDHLTTVSGVGSRPTWGTDTSQVLLVDVPGSFSRVSPVFAPPDLHVSY